MQNSFEYEIYIGCNDSQLHNCEIVKEQELEEIIARFLEKYKINFSIIKAKGVYIHKDGSFVAENTLIVTIVGANELDIIRLSKSLSMFMNQECSLVTRKVLKTMYN